MRKIMVIQHVAHEPLGSLLPLLKAAGFRIRYVNFGRHPDLEPSLDGYSGLIILGGPMGVYEADRFPHIKHEMRMIEDALKRNIPVLGICLGSQLIASALGAPVRKAPKWELGWYPVSLTQEGSKDALFSGYQSSEQLFQMHQDMFDPPRSAAHLALTTLCPGQAFRYGENVYGLQFHLEADRAMIFRWLNRPEHQKVIVESAGEFSSETLHSETQKYIERSLALSRESFTRFIEKLGLPDRHLILGSK